MEQPFSRVALTKRRAFSRRVSGPAMCSKMMRPFPPLAWSMMVTGGFSSMMGLL